MTAPLKVEDLLQEVRAIRPTRQDSERQFNLFKIIRSGHEEVSVHSRFLYELLNPRGAHGQGDVFLASFVRRFVPSNLKLEKVEVFRETDRIDISLRDVSSSSAVIIENKIYAGDQAQQLMRYYGTLRQNFEHVHILYLTLQGDAPGDDSLDGLHSDVWGMVSYLQIIKWLDDCLELVQSSQILGANIQQYKFLLEDLTGGPMDKTEKENLHQLLDQDGHYELALRLERALRSYREDTLERFWSEFMVEKVKSELGEGWVVEMEPPEKDWRNFRVAKESWWGKASVNYEFGRKWGLVRPGIGVAVSLPVDILGTAKAYEKVLNDRPGLYPQVHPRWLSGNTHWLSYKELGFSFSDPSYVARCRSPDHEGLLDELSRRIIELAKDVGPLVDEVLAAAGSVEDSRV